MHSSQQSKGYLAMFWNQNQTLLQSSYGIGTNRYLLYAYICHKVDNGFVRVGVGSYAAENYFLNPGEQNFDWVIYLEDASYCYQVASIIAQC